MSLRTGEKQVRNRDKQGRFTKGVSGNPGGRPKNDSVADRLWPLVPKAIERIKQILENEESSDRDIIRVAELVLDRVYGKAVQAQAPLDDDEGTGVIVLPAVKEDNDG